MRSDLPPLEISDAFTLEDIGKIREYNDLLFMNMTIDEQLAFYREAGDRANKRIAELRAAGVQPVYPKRISV
jgi:hypothetical protein